MIARAIYVARIGRRVVRSDKLNQIDVDTEVAGEISAQTERNIGYVKLIRWEPCHSDIKIGAKQGDASCRKRR